jgi:subtilase family serine protease
MFASAISMTATVAGLTVAGAGGSAGATVTSAVTTVAGSVAPFASQTRVIGNVPATQRLSIQLWLRPRTAAASRFADAVSTPGSSLFHNYLSPDAYAARFAATRSDVSQVGSWLRAEGFTAVSADPERAYVQATAATSTINRAFDVRLKLYRSSAAVNAGRGALWSNDRPVSLPASLAGIVLGVTGLDSAAPDNAAPTSPLGRSVSAAGQESAASSSAASAPCSTYYGQHLATGLPSRFGRTSFPTQVCGYSAKQLRAAYGVSLTSTGKGQTIAQVEMGLDSDMFLTLQDYAKASGLPPPSRKQYAQRSVGKPCAGASDEAEQPGVGPGFEEVMDVEASYAMAPAAKELVVGDVSCGISTESLVDTDEAVLDGSGHHPLASIVSNTWIGGPEAQSASLTRIENASLLQATAEGVGMYFASGDNPGLDMPASDPYATAVGGTTLGIGKTGNRLFETGWSEGWLLLQKGKWVNQGMLGGAGGGPSVLWKQPAYQRGVVPAALSRLPGKSGQYRSVPDISADADPAAAMAVGSITTAAGKEPKFTLTSGGGTSEATPLVAGIVAAAQQGAKKPFGFLNPALYKLAGTKALHDTLPLTARSQSRFRASFCATAICGDEELDIFDDQSLTKADGYTGQVTLKGYDNMTGVGTPGGPWFITALRALEK